LIVWNVEKNNTQKYFSFTQSPYVLNLLRKNGFEGITIFDEKNCCSEIEKIHMKSISMLSKDTKTKSPIWYRYFLLNKYNIQIKDKKNKDERFYKTYLSDIFTNKTKKIPYEDFINCKNKMGVYNKYYKCLDDEGSFKNLAYQMTIEDIKFVENKNTTHINKVSKKNSYCQT